MATCDVSIRVACSRTAGAKPQERKQQGRTCHAIPLPRRRDRRRRRRRLGALSPGEVRLEGRGADRAQRLDRRLLLARGRRRARPQRRSEHGGAAGLYDRPALGDRARERGVDRAPHDRRHHGGLGAGAVGMAAVGLSHLPDHRHRRLSPDDAGGDQGGLPDPRHRRRHRRPVGRPRGLCRHHRHGAGLCQGGAAARRRGDRAQPRAGVAPQGRRLAGRHREGHDHGRACRQCRRPVGQAGRAHGRRRPAGVAARAPLPPDRADPGDRRHGSRAAARGRSRGLHLHAPGPEGHAAGHLRDQAQALDDGRRALGLRRRTSAGGYRPHLRRARRSASSAIPACRRPASGSG